VESLLCLSRHIVFSQTYTNCSCVQDKLGNPELHIAKGGPCSNPLCDLSWILDQSLTVLAAALVGTRLVGNAILTFRYQSNVLCTRICAAVQSDDKCRVVLGGTGFALVTGFGSCILCRPHQISERFDSKLADVGNPLVRQLVRYLR